MRSFRVFRSPSLFQVTNWCSIFIFILFTFFCRTYGSSVKISYSDHCASVVPESSSTIRAQLEDFPVLESWTSYYTGGGNILGKESSVPAQKVSDSSYFLSFYATRNVFQTNTAGVYKIQALLKFRSPPVWFSNYSSFDSDRGYWSRRRGRFLLNGFWSETSRKLCMVGSAAWQSKAGELLKLEAVFKLNYALEKSTIFTGIAKGTLESLSPPKDPRYFQPIRIVSFPFIRDYNYTLATKDPDGGCHGGLNVPAKQSLSLTPKRICSFLYGRSYDFVLDYDSGCKDSKNCNPLRSDIAYLPRAMSLSTIQCFEEGEKLRYIIEFLSNSSSHRRYSLDPKTTLIGEGSWQRKKNQLCIIACRILNPSSSPGDAQVGDCSIRLNLRFPTVWTINSTNRILGQIWSSNPVNVPGYFKKMMFRSSTDYGWRSPSLRYEYSKVDMARESCSTRKLAVKVGNRYPKANSYELRFQMSIRDSGERVAWCDAVPISVGDDLYQGNTVILGEGGGEAYSDVISEDEENSNFASPMNISYKISLSVLRFKNKFSSLSYSLDPSGLLEISAEGIYDSERGLLCLVGCRELSSYNQNSTGQSMDCEILVNIEFPSLNSTDSSYIQGTIQSKRKRADPLFFDQLNISSYYYSVDEAKQSIWRVDLEIIMAIISNSLACLFVVLQIFFVKKHPEKLPFISLTMLTILTLGHFIPLVLNFEALILKNQYQHNVIFRGTGRLEVNEMSVRLVTMIAFLFLSRLLQLAWTARLGDGNDKPFWSEKRALSVSLPVYIAGGLITLLVSWKKNGNANGVLSSSLATAYQEGYESEQQSLTLIYLRSYAGLIVDGFLFPQILLNMFQSSRESSLSLSFYMGNTLVRLLPHAYDLYRIHTFRHQDLSGSYIYASPGADFYSIAWDVIILCGCVVFAMIIWLQQRFGGRCILPKKLRELELYEKVPTVVSSE